MIVILLVFAENNDEYSHPIVFVSIGDFSTNLFTNECTDPFTFAFPLSLFFFIFF